MGTTRSTLWQVSTGLAGACLFTLGVGAAERYALIPEVPTIAESGLPGYTAANWIGIVAPAGTPPRGRCIRPAEAARRWWCKRPAWAGNG